MTFDPSAPNGLPLRHQLRRYLLRAAEALVDERWADDEALAIARNTATTVLTAVDAADLAAVDDAA